MFTFSFSLYISSKSLYYSRIVPLCNLMSIIPEKINYYNQARPRQSMALKEIYTLLNVNSNIQNLTKKYNNE